MMATGDHVQRGLRAELARRGVLHDVGIDAICFLLLQVVLIAPLHELIRPFQRDAFRLFGIGIHHIDLNDVVFIFGRDRHVCLSRSSGSMSSPAL